ncbi:MAG: hypothetical protein LH468_03740 [Nocardioides sp.]|nr:hypothetical protein [Nocardioides sp.]
MADLTSFWRGIELVHDVVYFAPGAKERYEALGLRGYWMGYFASRAGALGAEPTPAVVTATFHGFAPAMVHRALPDAWALADRVRVLEERVDIARDTLSAALNGALDRSDIPDLAQRLVPVLAGLDLAGKPLAAAEASLPVPDDAVGALWRRATVLREFRGDCHVAVLVSEGLGGALANVLAVATGRAPEHQRRTRGWSEPEWAAARADLRQRGWTNDDGTASISGRSTRDRLEDATDRACQAAMTTASVVAAEDVTGVLQAAAAAITATGVVPFPNPVGVARPS